MRWVVCAVAIGGLVHCSEGSPEEPLAPVTRKQVLLEASRTFAVVADARVEDSYPIQNFGNESALRTDGDPRYESFLRFEVSGLSGLVIRARLRLYATDATVGGPAVYTTGTEWEESKLTFQSKPAVQIHLSATDPVAANTWIEWDVTHAVQGNGTVNLAVMPTGTDGTVFYSRDTSLAAPDLMRSGGGETAEVASCRGDTSQRG